MKSRAERNEIYFNWIEGALVHEIELIGPDGADPALSREDSDVAGNVFRKTNDAYTVRVGGDGTGETRGRYRFVHNTFLLGREHRPVFRVFDGIESIEMHGNVIASEGGGGVRVAITEDAKWVTGREAMFGTNNWIPQGSRDVPAGWTGTQAGRDPGFENLSVFDLRPRQGSPLRDAATKDPRCPSEFAFPSPLTKVLFQPPRRSAAEPVLIREQDQAPDIGAYEGGFALRAVLQSQVEPASLRTAGGAGGTLGPARPGAGAGRCGCQVTGALGNSAFAWLLASAAALSVVVRRRCRPIAMP
ncbi:MAG: hypothetical protein MUF54_17725 [Polyangiaceae bacterium]|nr:hypothetical protein [Polyangiaceae bacterium]